MVFYSGVFYNLLQVICPLNDATTLFVMCVRICMIFSSILFHKGIQKYVYLVFNCRNSLLSAAM
jgi:hypothetical protein